MPDDDGGHLIARVFGGSKDIDNLVPQSNTSTAHLKRTENGITWKRLAKAIKGGGTIKNIKIEVQYESHSQRPTAFQVK